MKRLMLPDKRPLDLVEGPSVLGLLHVLVLDRLLIKFIDADRVCVGQPTFSYLLVGQCAVQGGAWANQCVQRPPVGCAHTRPGDVTNVTDTVGDITVGYRYITTINGSCAHRGVL